MVLVNMSACTYFFVSTYVSSHVHMSAHLHLYVHVWVCTYECTRVPVCERMYPSACLCFMCIQMFVFSQVRMYTSVPL